ncbi:MAG: hypothetical protein RLZZ63_1206 [Gemmatimonadota bacterium]|jgi:hypothetical protein
MVTDPVALVAREVAREVARIRRDDRVRVAALGAAWALAGLATAAMLLGDGRWIAWPALLPVLCWCSVLAGLVVIGWRGHHWSARRTAPLTVARTIEGEQGLRRGALVGVLELASTPGVLVDAAASQVGQQLAPAADALAPRAAARRRRGMVLVAAAMLGASLVAGLSWRAQSDGWRVMRRPIAAARGQLLTPLRFEGLPIGVARGSSLAIDLRADGRPTVQVTWRPLGAGWRDTLLAVAADGRARLTLARVDADLRLVASDGRVTTDTTQVRAVDRPFLGDVRVTAAFPAYLGRAPESVDAEMPLQIPEGTVLTIDGRASEALASVALVPVAAIEATGAIVTTARVALTAEGLRFRGRFAPTRSGMYAWEAVGRSTPIEDLPAPLAVEVIPDLAPRISIVSPEGPVRVDPASRVAIEVVAEDDHRLGTIAIRRQVIDAAGQGGASAETALSSGGEAAWVGAVQLDLAALRLTPGTTVRLVVVAREAGPRARVVESAPLELRVPTADEGREAAREVGDAAAAAAVAAARAQAALAERTADAAQARDRGALRAERAEQAREIAAQQRAVQEKVAELEATAQSLEARLRQAGALDTTLARQLQDAQRLLREALSGSLDASLQRLDAARESGDADRTRQSLAEVAAQQQRMREALERSAQLLQRAALEGAMRTTADQAEALAKDQRRFADSIAASSAVQDSAARPATAEQLARRADALEQAVEAMAQRLASARAQTGARGAREAAEAARRAEAAAREGAAETAAQAAEAAARTLAETQRAQLAEWRGELTSALDRSVQELLQLAREQERVAQDARQDPADPGVRARQSAVQQGVQAAQQRLAEQARQSALVSPRSQQTMAAAQQQVSEAARQVQQGGPGASSTEMREAADALRQAAQQLTRDRERAASASSASGFPELMQQLQQAAQQQGAMNGQLQSLLSMARAAGQSGSEGLDEQGQAQARRLAQSQRAVAQALDEAADVDPSGRAQEMAREARGLAQQLDQGIVSPATEQRLERLLRRMLDAGRSLEQEERDATQRREARAAARDPARFTPVGSRATGAEAQRFATPSWAELRALSPEERALALEYFRRLNAERVP